MTYETRAHQLFGVIISLLKDAPFTIVITSQSGFKGGNITISQATHEQAARSCAETHLFTGTGKETLAYLKGMRDLLTVIKP